MIGNVEKKGSTVRLCMKRKVSGMGLIIGYDCEKEEEYGLFEYVKVSDKWMLKVVGESGCMWDKKNNKYKKREEKARKETFWEKRLHGKYMRDVNKWHRKGCIFISGAGLQTWFFKP